MKTMTREAELLDLATNLIEKARACGADAAEAMMVESRSLSLAYRNGKQEQLDRSEAIDLGLRVFHGHRQAIVSTSDLSPSSLAALVDLAISMARVVPEDPYCGLAEPDQLITHNNGIDIYEDGEPRIDILLARAAEAEDAARTVTGITNSEGAESSWGTTIKTIVTTNGLEKKYSRSWNSLAVSVVAGDGTAMERDYDFSTSVHADDLRSPSEIGRSAGRRAVRRLNPRKIASGNFPIVFDRRVSRSLLGHLSSAVNGSAVTRRTTFLKDKLKHKIFPAAITIVDDPLRKRGLKSRPFDAEGIAPRLLKIVDKGVLNSWVLDLRSARQLGMPTTGHASRGLTAPPSPSTTNLYLEPGDRSLEDLLADIKQGFYATELIGFGVNGITGDYSRGASGFWIEDGQTTYPVSEVTIAGNLPDMFANVSAANDLEFRYGTDAPSLRVEGMTVAGK
ncbi:MAG: TldD/PmbA family protein [Candidatus Binatia bacterium]